MYDLHNSPAIVWAAQGTLTSTGSPNTVTSGAIDLSGYEAAEVFALLGSVDELGGSPVGGAKADLELAHSDDGITWTLCALADVIPHSSVAGVVTAGVVATSTGRFTAVQAGYRGGKKYVRASLIATSLANGGPVAIGVAKGNPRHVGTTS